MSNLTNREMVLSIFEQFLKAENITTPTDQMTADELIKTMDLFNKKVQKYHLNGDTVIELNLGNGSGDIDFKTYSISEFVHKAGKFEEAAELYISRKDAETRIWVALTAIMLIGLIIVWLV